jgi:hypothetical protein
MSSEPLAAKLAGFSNNSGWVLGGSGSPSILGRVPTPVLCLVPRRLRQSRLLYNTSHLPGGGTGSKTHTCWQSICEIISVHQMSKPASAFLPPDRDPWLKDACTKGMELCIPHRLQKIFQYNELCSALEHLEGLVEAFQKELQESRAGVCGSSSSGQLPGLS